MEKSRSGVRITAIGFLKELLPDAVIVSPGRTVYQIIIDLCLDTEATIMPLVNGHVVSMDCIARQGDEIVLVQVIGGGYQ